MTQLPIEDINSRIYTIRDIKVMLDSDIAKLYEVETKVLNQAVKRNTERFPNDLMFELSKEEFEILRSQNVTSSWGGRRYNPKVFTEQGVYMLATVLKSKVATQVTLTIMRTFTALRRYALTYDELAKKITQIESRVSHGEKTDKQIIEVLNQLMQQDRSSVDKIGFIKE